MQYILITTCIDAVLHEHIIYRMRIAGGLGDEQTPVNFSTPRSSGKLDLGKSASVPVATLTYTPFKDTFKN